LSGANKTPYAAPIAKPANTTNITFPDLITEFFNNFCKMIRLKNLFLLNNYCVKMFYR
jgi:hypothetical protein